MDFECNGQAYDPKTKASVTPSAAPRYTKPVVSHGRYENLSKDRKKWVAYLRYLKNTRPSPGSYEDLGGDVISFNFPKQNEVLGRRELR